MTVLLHHAVLACSESDCDDEIGEAENVVEETASELLRHNALCKSAGRLPRSSYPLLDSVLARYFNPRHTDF